MQSRTKTLLLIFSIGVFFFIAPLVILYAQGYRLSFREEPFAIRRTGGLSVVTLPRGAVISLDGEPVGASPLFYDGIEPGWHEVRITRTGYQPARRLIRILPNRVAVLEKLLLLPSSARFQQRLGRVRRLAFAPDGRGVALVLENDPRRLLAGRLTEPELAAELTLPAPIVDFELNVDPQAKQGLLAVRLADETQRLYRYFLNERLIEKLKITVPLPGEQNWLSLVKRGAWETQTSFISTNTKGSLLRLDLSRKRLIVLPPPRGQALGRIALRGSTLFGVTDDGRLLKITPRSETVLAEGGITDFSFRSADPQPTLAYNRHELFLIRESEPALLLARFQEELETVFALTDRHFLIGLGQQAFLLSLVERGRDNSSVRLMLDRASKLMFDPSANAVHWFDAKDRKWLEVKLEI